MTERELRFLRSLSNALLGIQQQLNAIRNQEERRYQEQKTLSEPPPVPVIHAELHTPERIDRQQQTSSNRNFAVQVVLTVGTWLAFLAAAIYAGIAHQQWTTSENTLTEVRKQSMLMRQQLVGSQGAVLAFDLGFNRGPSNLSVSLRNDGHVSAKDMHVRIDGSSGKLPSGSPDGPTISFSADAPAIAANAGFNKEWPLPWRLPQLGPAGKWPKGWPGTVTYVFQGEYSYDNGFDETVRQRFCKAWLPSYTIVFAAQTNGNNGGLVPCDDVKVLIDSTLDLERQAEQGADRPQ